MFFKDDIFWFVAWVRDLNPCHITDIKGVAKKIIQILLPEAASWYSFLHFCFIWRNADIKSFPMSYRRFLWDIWVQIYISFTTKLIFTKSSILSKKKIHQIRELEWALFWVQKECKNRSQASLLLIFTFCTVNRVNHSFLTISRLLTTPKKICTTPWNGLKYLCQNVQKLA